VSAQLRSDYSLKAMAAPPLNSSVEHLLLQALALNGTTLIERFGQWL